MSRREQAGRRTHMNRMKLLPPLTSGLAATPVAPDPPADPTVLQLRAVHRAVADLKRGTPVLVECDAPLVVLPAETAGARGLSELTAIAGAPPVLLLAPARAAAVLRRPV